MELKDVSMIDKCAEALEKLTTIFQDGEKPSFQEAIEARLDLFWGWLKTDENALLLSSLKDFLANANIVSSDANNVSFRFSLALLGLLTCLRHALEQVRADGRPITPRQHGELLPSGPAAGEDPDEEQRTTSTGGDSLAADGGVSGVPGGRRLHAAAAAPLPPDTLSVWRHRLVARSVQLVVVLTVLPALPRGVGVSLEDRTDFAADIRSAATSATDPYQRRDQALVALHHLLPLFSDRSLRDSVTSHLGDVIALLLLVTSAPLAKEGKAGMTAERRSRMEAERQTWTAVLERLLNAVPERLLLPEFLVLQRCALSVTPPRRWVHERCTFWLFRSVRRPGGLATVTKALLHFWGQDRLDDVDNSRIQAVAKMLVSPHPAHKTADYYCHLSSEILSLLRIPRTEVRVSTLRVAAALTSCLWERPESADCVRNFIVHPLLGCLLSGGDVTLPSEDDVTTGLTSCWQLFVAGMEPGSPCLASLRPYVGSLFQLYSAIYSGVSHLKTPCKELLERFLRHAGNGTDVLDEVLLAEGLGSGRRFAAGDSGGVIVQAVPADETDNWLLDDSGAAEAFVALVCGAGAPEMVADVFRTLLSRLGDVMSLSVPGFPSQAASSDSRVTLRQWEEETAEKRRSFRSGLLVLRALAAMAESQQAVSALDDTARLLPVINALLETFQSADDASDVTEAGQSLLRVETICLAMGVIAGMLGRETTTSSVWQTARQLVPALERLEADQGGVQRVRDMARDLRQLVLTNGVVDNDMLTQDRYSSHRAAEKCPTNTKPEPQVDVKREDDMDEGSRHDQATSSAHRTQVKPDPDYKLFPPLSARVPPVPSVDESPVDSVMTYERAMYDLADPLLPVRAHALTTLTQLLQKKDPDTWAHRQRLLTIFQEKLSDDDSYVYLAAVRGLACLADLCTDDLVSTLCAQYTGHQRDTQTRLKLGEALLIMVRNLGDVAPKYGPPLLSAFLRGCRDEEPLLRASSLSNLAELCRLLRYSLHGSTHEIFSCLSALLDTDRALEVRRAAVLVLSQVLDGLGGDALNVLDDLLSPLYRKLKLLLRREEDPALLHHVETALNKLETATRAILFPARKLEKRITVLAPP